MVGINATNQGYAMIQPWSKENPAYSQGFGIYLGRRQYPDGSQYRLFRQLRGSNLRRRSPDGSRDSNRL